MTEPQIISLENVKKSDVAICPECGTLFVKRVKGPSWGFLGGTKIHCPACDTFVMSEDKENGR